MNHSVITTTLTIAEESIELFGGEELTIEQLAQASRLSAQWLASRVHAGVLAPIGVTHADIAQSSSWRFSSATLVRARKVAELENCFDADPQLAALAVDLMEEVALLRKRLQMAAGSDAAK